MLTAKCLLNLKTERFPVRRIRQTIRSAQAFWKNFPTEMAESKIAGRFIRQKRAEAV